MLAKQDQLAVIKIEGMHCHRCEQQIQRVLAALPGVHEVEVDFPSAQASILYGEGEIGTKELMQAINQAGYKAASVSRRQVSKSQN